MSREADSNEIAGIRAIVKITSFAAYAAPTNGQVSGEAPAEHGSALHQTQKPNIKRESRHQTQKPGFWPGFWFCFHVGALAQRTSS